MKVIIFGASGSIGRNLVSQALEQGHAVTAFVRDPARFDMQHDKLSIAVGDVLEATSVQKAVAGHDAVMCTIGAGRKGGVRAEGTRNIIAAMKAASVRRLICQSTLGIGESWNNLNVFWKYLMFGLFIRPAFLDHVEQEKLVRESGLDWSIVRPAAFTDGGLTGQYRHGFPATANDTKLEISRADVADFMLKNLVDNTYLRKTPGLSY
ncbi:MAG: SDR family oxidoreductase [Gammaproteobacteria bacterium]|nr:SDR family oxidoreductase [Gammaproteobacteria bacterium]MBT8132861.1 SDR family oxidoreductase [Gammaproteobacteria bacterium]NNJ50478.1 SDR family oxidoreductase [Gammaproteobacteria bacterium]